MKEKARNVAVGLTVMVALAMFCGMIILFAGLPGMFQTGEVLRMEFPDSYGVQTGEWVYMAGLRIGKITGVEFARNDPRAGVMFICRIDRGVVLPSNIEPTISSRGFMGGGMLELRIQGPNRVDPATGKEMTYLPANWTEPLKGRYVPQSVLPKELTKSLEGLSKLGDSIGSLIGEPAGSSTTGPATGPAARPISLRGTLGSLQQALDDVHTVLGDKENQENLRKTLADLAVASAKASKAIEELKVFAGKAGTAAEQAGKTLAATSQAVDKFGALADHADRRIEEIAAKVAVDAEKLGEVLDSINRVVTKMDTGEGTVGKLLNDPKLYNSFIEASRQFSDLAAEIRVLIQQWQKGGVGLKMK